MYSEHVYEAKQATNHLETGDDFMLVTQLPNPSYDAVATGARIVNNLHHTANVKLAADLLGVDGSRQSRLRRFWFRSRRQMCSSTTAAAATVAVRVGVCRGRVVGVT